MAPTIFGLQIQLGVPTQIPKVTESSVETSVG
jgi:hypothetical protein